MVVVQRRWCELLPSVAGHAISDVCPVALRLNECLCTDRQILRAERTSGPLELELDSTCCERYLVALMVLDMIDQPIDILPPLMCYLLRVASATTRTCRRRVNAIVAAVAASVLRTSTMLDAKCNRHRGIHLINLLIHSHNLCAVAIQLLVIL